MQLGIYQHYKGMEYLVLCLGKIEENLEEAVVYQALYDDYSVWIRPLSVFQETVSVPEVPYQGPRFRFLRPWSEDEARRHPKAFQFPQA